MNHYFPKDFANRHPGRVILTHGRSLHALVAARSLGARGVEVIGCDETPLMAMSFSKYVAETFLHPPIESEEEFVAALVEKVGEHQPSEDVPYVLMPLHRETRLLARHRHLFEPRIQLACPPLASIGQVFPKDKLIATAERLRIPIPRSWLVGSKRSLEDCISEITFPAFIKLTDGTAGFGLRGVGNPTELRQTFETFSDRFNIGVTRNVLIQEAAAGDDYCLAALLQRGSPRAAMCYRNLEKHPRSGGFGVLRETVDAGPLRPIAEKLLAATRWHGVAEVDFRWTGDPENPPTLIEVNPRFWSGLFHSVESGIDFPWMLYQMTATGCVAPAPSAEPGTRTRLPLITLLGELQDLVVDEHAFKRLRDGMSSAWHELRDGHPIRGVKELGESLADAADPNLRYQHVRDWLENTFHTKTEIFSTDDWMPALGLLYILGSLVRNGRLPEEMHRHGLPAPGADKE